MLNGHPKGLFVLAATNTGERFGYYTMLAIFTLYLQAHYGWSSAATSQVFGIFLAAVYFLPVIGGIVADKFLGYGKTITLGTIVMFLGYALLAFPIGSGAIPMFIALGFIALGTGFFKGNLQVLVGNLYDNPKYSKNRDLAYSIFYMCINIGAFFAPSMAEAISNYILKGAGMVYNSKIPALAHQLFDGTIAPGSAGYEELVNLATAQGASITDLSSLQQFAHTYIDTLSQSYQYGFGVACISLIASLAIFAGFRKYYKSADATEKEKAQGKGDKDAVVLELTKEQTRERVIALILVFIVVIFFWMAFHQNGLTLTFFARDYTARTADGAIGMSFNVFNLVFVITLIYSLFSLFQSKEAKSKLISAVVAVISVSILVYKYLSLAPGSFIEVLPQMFQHFNPFFVVALTPVSLAVFGALAKRGSEPSAPRKIGIGMFIAALGFTVMALSSMGLPTPNPDGAIVVANDLLVSPSVLINTYLVLTFAELFLSPMGISFVSKVAPPKYKGLMMGLWFGATAVGNYLVSIIGMLWGHMPLWALWSILIVLCLISALFIFMMMKRLENATK